MHMVEAQTPFQYFAFLLFRQLMENNAKPLPQLDEKYLFSVIRYPYDIGTCIPIWCGLGLLYHPLKASCL
jgi:hypothetical protein